MPGKILWGKRLKCCQIQFDNNYRFACHWLPQFALDAPTHAEVQDGLVWDIDLECLLLACEEALVDIAVAWKLVDPKDDVQALAITIVLPPVLQEWASTESGLHRCLSSKILARHGRTKKSRCGQRSLLGIGRRKPGSNMAKLKDLVTFIYKAKIYPAVLKFTKDAGVERRTKSIRKPMMKVERYLITGYVS